MQYGVLHPINVPKPQVAVGLFHFRHTGWIDFLGRMRFIVTSTQASESEYQDG
jgi:hypothetical protein